MTETAAMMLRGAGLKPAPTGAGVPRSFTVQDHPGRGCCTCKHYRIQHDLPWCIHPVNKLPVAWRVAISAGQPCGADNAPLYEARLC